MVSVAVTALLDGQLVGIIIRPGGHIAAVLSHGLPIAGVIVGIGNLLDDRLIGLLMGDAGSLPGGIVDIGRDRAAVQRECGNQPDIGVRPGGHFAVGIGQRLEPVVVMVSIRSGAAVLVNHRGPITIILLVCPRFQHLLGVVGNCRRMRPKFAITTAAAIDRAERNNSCVVIIGSAISAS